MSGEVLFNVSTFDINSTQVSDVSTNVKEGSKQVISVNKSETSAKSHKVSGFQVNFVSIPANEEGHIPRSHIVDEVININTLHPDFMARMKSKLGRPKFTERIAAYLAVVISAHYNDVLYTKANVQPNRDKIYDDLIGVTNRIETALRRRIPQLQRGITEVMPQSAVDTLQDDNDTVEE